MLNAELSAEDRGCLDEFLQARSLLLRHSDSASFSSARDEELPHYRSTQIEDIGTHELLIAEVSVRA